MPKVNNVTSPEVVARIEGESVDAAEARAGTPQRSVRMRGTTLCDHQSVELRLESPARCDEPDLLFLGDRTRFRHEVPGSVARIFQELLHVAQEVPAVTHAG